MNNPFLRTRTTWVAYLLLALYAYFLNILGPITPYLQNEFSLSYTISSLHFSAFAVGILVAGVTGHIIIQRFGRWLALAVGAIGLGLGALLLILGSSPIVTIGAAFGMGCVGSLILAVVPTALSEEHGENRAIALSEANTLSSIVAASAPLMVGWLANILLGWRLALILVAVLALCIGIYMLKPGKTLSQRPSLAPTQSKLPFLYWFYWAGIVLAVACEFCMAFWAANFMEAEFGMPRASAAQSVSLFLAGMILGRWLSSRLLQYISTRNVVLASILISLAGFLLYWSTPAVGLGLAGLAITGLGIASLYPSILSMSIGASGNETLAGARATLASGTAILVLPLVLGRLADWIGLKPAFALVAALLGILFLMIFFVQKIAPFERVTESQREGQSFKISNGQ